VVARETPVDQRKLAAYAALVRRHAGRVDLVSPRDLERFEERHIHDSLRLLPLLEELPPGPCVDVGSGAGLPGIPLALAAPRRRWRLLEPRRKRAAFLEEVVRELDLACDIFPLSAEEAAREPSLRRTHVLATARALAPPPRAFRLLRPLVEAGGSSVVFAGKDAPIPAEAEWWRPGLARLVSRQER
jgi:16S rRNA (guanine527-N7)-methyltransferase